MFGLSSKATPSRHSIGYYEGAAAARIIPTAEQERRNIAAQFREVTEESLDEVGKLMLSAARVVSAGGGRVTSDYLVRMMARRKAGGWPSA